MKLDILCPFLRFRARARLPHRDKAYSLYLIGILAFAGAVWGLARLPIPGLVQIAMAAGVSFLLLNLLLFHIPIFPYDRIISAFSHDGLQWQRERGVRLDVDDLHDSCQVYHPSVVAVRDGGWRLYYRAGGYASVIGSAFSHDGQTWQVEPGVRISTGGRFALQKVDSPEVIRLGTDDWRLYYAGMDRRSWKIYSSRSADGLRWEDEGICIDTAGDELLPEVKYPSIIRTESGYRLFFMRFARAQTSICTAVSDDGLVWKDLVPCKGIRDEKKQVKTPCVVSIPEGKLRMYFSEYGPSAAGSQIVSAISDNGIDWCRELGVRLAPGGEYDTHGAFCPELVPDSDGWRMYYGGFWGWHCLAPYTLLRHRKGKPISS